MIEENTGIDPYEDELQKDYPLFVWILAIIVWALLMPFVRLVNLITGRFAK